MGNHKGMKLHAFSVKSLTPLNSTATRLILSPKGKTLLAFKPGQYVFIQLDANTTLPYSVACAPNTDSTLEFHIRVGDKGSYSERIIHLAKTQQELLVSEPNGHCILNNSNSKILLIAGGTGFSQMKAFIEHLVASNSQRAIKLYWGLKTPEHGYMYAELAEWKKTLSDFDYTFIYSDPEEAQPEPLKGFIHEHLLSLKMNLDNTEAYVSGPKAMVDATKSALINMGLKNTNLFSDL